MHAAVVWDLFHMFVSAIEVFLVPSKQGAPLRAEWLELLVERLYFILTKYRAARAPLYLPLPPYSLPYSPLPTPAYPYLLALLLP